jgi:hypothetical protein
MTHYILDKTYEVEEANGIPAHRTVIVGTAPGQATLPGAANVGGFLGITTHGQTRDGGSVSVRKAGIARVEAAGAIALGAPVNIAGTTGRVKAIDEAGGTKVECIGYAESTASAAGDLVEVFILPHERTA